MSTLTTPQDIVSRWVSDEQIPANSQLQVFINDVENQILQKFPKFYENVLAGLPAEDVAVSHIAWIIIEFLQTKGTAYSQISQSYNGTGTTTVGYSTTTGRFTLKLTKEDFKVFSPSGDSSIGSFNFVPNLETPRNAGWNRKRISW